MPYENSTIEIFAVGFSCLSLKQIKFIILILTEPFDGPAPPCAEAMLPTYGYKSKLISVPISSDCLVIWYSYEA